MLGSWRQGCRCRRHTGLASLGILGLSPGSPSSPQSGVVTASSQAQEAEPSDFPGNIVTAGSVQGKAFCSCGSVSYPTPTPDPPDPPSWCSFLFKFSKSITNFKNDACFPALHSPKVFHLFLNHSSSLPRVYVCSDLRCFAQQQKQFPSLQDAAVALCPVQE